MNLAISGQDRWLGYVLRGGDQFVPFWKSLVKSSERNLLFLVGGGFDPRMCTSIETILSLGGKGARHCLIIEYDEEQASPSRAHEALITSNVNRLDNLFNGSNGISKRQIQMWSEDGKRRVRSRRAAEILTSADISAGYTDILLDINALPRSLYMPMLAKLLYLIDGSCRGNGLNLHVLTNDNPALDKSIAAKGLSDDATYLHGFGSDIELEATAGVPKVWMPILGEGMVSQFRRIYDLVTPGEIVPILPFPCTDPRRTDNLLLEYRSYLFDRLRIEPTNFIYVPEQNPFGVYREIVSAVKHYADALAPLGGCKVVISALSSKLLSLGGLLAAYDLKHQEYIVGIAHVEAEGYTMSDNTPKEDHSGDLFDIWIAGEPYDLP